ncbi:hypothetical protein SAMD00023353_3300820 [Rosellinia necatrix]|uniref:Uncharacterized protein n=1 Tax=Rosellinia necatrix TaxID=77044 RepID=A0A1W2TK38_ROSNE|nr:hypothetical protein SAMD00023353_3300820 [Rosellinia necatrix]
MSTSAATAHSGVVLRSPVVRAPLAAAAWARNTGERESDLDPVYRVTMTTRTRTTAPKIAPALVVAAVVLCAAALTTLWPGGHFSGKPAAAGIARAVLPPRLQASKSPSSSSGSSSADNIRTAAREYGYFMTATEDYSDWFAGADAATRAIDAELASLPPPPPPPPRPSSRAGDGDGDGDGVRDCEAEAAYERDRGLVEARARHLRLARGEWDAFQTTRERLVGALAGAGPQWRAYAYAYADDRPVPSSPPSAVWRAAGVGGRRCRRLGGDFFNATTKAAAVDGEKKEEEERRDECEDGHREARGRAALVRSARCVVGELGRTRAELFAAWDPAQTHLRAAAEAEDAFVGGLVRRGGGRPRSTVWAAAWTGVALRELQGRMRTLGQRNETMATALEALREGGLGGGGGGEGGEGDDDDSSVENAKELLRAWSEVLMDAQEGVLYMLRRRDVRGRPRGVAGQEGSWEAWKSRNCGSTSCYEAPSAAGDIKRMFGKGNPAAGVAQDEVNWTKSLGGDGTLRVPRGVYEKACCENGVLAHRLKYGSNQLSRQK